MLFIRGGQKWIDWLSRMREKGGKEEGKGREGAWLAAITFSPHE